jgi:hypothetical protein
MTAFSLDHLLDTPYPVYQRRTQVELGMALSKAIGEGAVSGDITPLKALLDEGAHPNRWREKEGFLLHAMELQWWEGAEVLVQSGARLPDYPGMTVAPQILALEHAFRARDKTRIDWVHRVVNQGVIIPPGWTSTVSYALDRPLRSHPKALDWFIRQPSLHALPSTPDWLGMLMTHIAAHGEPSLELLERYNSLLPPPLATDLPRLWTRAVCSEAPKSVLPAFSRLIPLPPDGLLRASDGTPMVWHAALCNRPDTFRWLMTDPAVRTDLDDWLAQTPDAIETLFCSYTKASILIDNHPLRLQGTGMWAALKEEGLLPNEATMQAWKWEKSPKFCLRNLITEGVLTPAMLDWVCDNWPHALTMTWKKGSPNATAPLPLLDELTQAHAAGVLAFDGRAQAERRLLQKALPDRDGDTSKNRNTFRL